MSNKCGYSLGIFSPLIIGQHRNSFHYQQRRKDRLHLYLFLFLQINKFSSSCYIHLVRVYLTTQAVLSFTLCQIDFIAIASHNLSVVVACHGYDVFLFQLFHRFHNGTATDMTVTYNAVVAGKAFACDRVPAL